MHCRLRLPVMALPPMALAPAEAVLGADVLAAGLLATVPPAAVVEAAVEEDARGAGGATAACTGAVFGLAAAAFMSAIALRTCGP